MRRNPCHCRSCRTNICGVKKENVMKNKEQIPKPLSKYTKKELEVRRKRLMAFYEGISKPINKSKLKENEGK